MKFFALYRADKHSGVRVEAADSLAQIEHNAILDEYVGYPPFQVSNLSRENK
jgi:hypothetical protein